MIVERMNFSDTVTPKGEDAMKYLVKAIPVLFPNINTMPNEIKNIIHSLKSKNSCNYEILE
jgi:hypothetical protein